MIGNHLPECQPTNPEDGPLICICDELRACERRVLNAVQESINKIPREDGGYCHVLHACDVEDVINDLKMSHESFA